MSTVNAWKYGREVYLIGRSHKFRYLSEAERACVIEFITAIIETRPSLLPRLNLKYENAGQVLEKQNSYALLKMVQQIGRNLKVLFPTEQEKALCDTLIEAVAPRAKQGYNGYVDGATSSAEQSSAEESSAEQSSSEESSAEQSSAEESSEQSSSAQE